MQILVVDNECSQLENLRIGLNIRGHQVLQARSGREASVILENNDWRIDLVITDYDMPEMNGLELLQFIRTRHGTLPVIMMTGFPETERTDGMMKHRCDAILEKPFTLDRLVGLIGRVSPQCFQNSTMH
jgi:DNA-binding NtrC family response regulator